MKTLLLNLFFAIVIMPLLAQENQPELKNQDDPFLNYVTRMYHLNGFAYETKSVEKSLFSTDTVRRYGNVEVGKSNDSVYYVRIREKAGVKELLLFQDSAWSVNHEKQEVSLIGHGATRVSGNYLVNFFPLSLFTLDTSIYRLEPFWETVKENDREKVVSIHIYDMPKEITDIRYEVTIRDSDSLVYLIVEDVEFGEYQDNLYQEKHMFNYRIYETFTVQRPDYMDHYRRILPGEMEVEAKHEETPAGDKESVFLNDLGLQEINGQPFTLPSEGLIFIDLWYVGCYPCMKAAPIIEKLFHEFRDVIHFYSVNEIDRDILKIERFKESLGISFPVLLNSGESLAVRVNGSNAYPAYFIMDAKTNEVLWREGGYSEDLENKIRTALEGILY